MCWAGDLNAARIQADLDQGLETTDANPVVGCTNLPAAHPHDGPGAADNLAEREAILLDVELPYRTSEDSRPVPSINDEIFDGDIDHAARPLEFRGSFPSFRLLNGWSGRGSQVAGAIEQNVDVA